MKNLEDFDSIPQSLQETIFEQAFSVAEIAKFNIAQLEAYEYSLKHYRDWDNIINSAAEERVQKVVKKVVEKAKFATIEQEKIQRIQIALTQGVLSIEQITALFEVSVEFVQQYQSQSQ